MHWTDAVNVSAVRIAVRQNKLPKDQRLMYRCADGSGEIELYSSADRQAARPLFRFAKVYELENFDDWSPAVTREITRDLTDELE